MKKVILVILLTLSVSALDYCDATKSNVNEYYSNARVYYAAGDMQNLKKEAKKLFYGSKQGLEECKGSADRYKFLEYKQFAQKVLSNL